jgi:peptide chain release factor 2
MENLVSVLTEYKTTIDGLMTRLDIAGKVARLQAIEEQASATDFWNDPEAAQKLMQEMSALKTAVEKWQTVSQRINDTLELAELDDEDLLDELTQEAKALEPIVERLAFQALFSGPYDSENAILAIHAGAGGTDSQDWGAMLERMYLRWAEENG